MGQLHSVSPARVVVGVPDTGYVFRTLIREEMLGTLSCQLCDKLSPDLAQLGASGVTTSSVGTSSPR